MLDSKSQSPSLSDIAFDYSESPNEFMQVWSPSALAAFLRDNQEAQIMMLDPAKQKRWFIALCEFAGIRIAKAGESAPAINNSITGCFNVIGGLEKKAMRGDFTVVEVELILQELTAILARMKAIDVKRAVVEKAERQQKFKPIGAVDAAVDL